MDLDAFDCPVCLSQFQGPIFQRKCKNGHVVCDACRVTIKETCPFCFQPIGDIQWRELENTTAGSGRALPGWFRSDGCPFQGCAYSGLLLTVFLMAIAVFWSAQ